MTNAVQIDARASARTTVSLPASVRQRGRARTAVQVIDISNHGCRIEIAQGLPANDWVWLTISGLETQYCRTVWGRGEFAGLEFAAPLHDAVLQRLIAESETCSEAEEARMAELVKRCRTLAQRPDVPGSEQVACLGRDASVRLLTAKMRQKWG